DALHGRHGVNAIGGVMQCRCAWLPQTKYESDRLFSHFERMVQSRRTAEREADFHARNSVVTNYYPYIPIVCTAARRYTPSIFAMFQEQYVRVLEYKLELIPSILIENGAAYTSYKMHQGQRLGERVVRADRER
ncbi:hypothetical protein LINPERHAP2_LOCUS39842, partial [Linum perenne]